MKYKNYLLGSSLAFASLFFQTYANSPKNCVEFCTENNCRSNKKLADNCMQWCQGLPQYQNRSQICQRYATPGNGFPPLPNPNPIILVPAPLQPQYGPNNVPLVNPQALPQQVPGPGGFPPPPGNLPPPPGNLPPPPGNLPPPPGNLPPPPGNLPPPPPPVVD